MPQTPVPIVLAPEPPHSSSEPSPPRREWKRVPRRVARATIAPAAVAAAAPMQARRCRRPSRRRACPAAQAPSRGKGEAVILITTPPQTPSPQPSDFGKRFCRSYSDATRCPNKPLFQCRGRSMRSNW